MRLFFAFSVASDLSLRIDQWRSQVLPPIHRAIPMQNFHITLGFIGEVPAAKLDSICQCADELLQESAWPSFQLSLDQVGYWPKAGIFWLGPTVWPAPLDDMANTFAKLCARFGSRQTNRRYQPHLSLFRTSDLPPAPLLAPQFTLSCDELVLYQSVNQRQGVYYEALAEWPLAKKLYSPGQTPHAKTHRRHKAARVKNLEQPD